MVKSHTECTEYTEFLTEEQKDMFLHADDAGILCIPWIPCEKNSHAKAQRTRSGMFFCSSVKYISV